MASKIFGIDFGTDSIKICRKGAGLIYFQKTILAVKNKKTVIAIGNEAFDMYGKVPEKIEIEFPIKGGVITSIDKMLSLMNCIFLDLSKEYGKFRNSTFYAAVSADLTDIEKKAFYDVLDGSFINPKRIILYDKPAVDALGCQLDYGETAGTMLVNIGSETTEISVLYSGSIVVSKLFKYGGHDIDEAIINAVRRNFNILIGSKTAEQSKRRVVTLNEVDKKIRIYGRDIVSGLPKDCEISSELLRSHVIEQFATLIEAIKSVLERTPPEISAEIYKHGIWITGGTAKIPGIVDLIEDGTGLKVHLAEDPTDTVINGLLDVMEGRYHLEQQ